MGMGGGAGARLSRLVLNTGQVIVIRVIAAVRVGAPLLGLVLALRNEVSFLVPTQKRVFPRRRRRAAREEESDVR